MREYKFGWGDSWFFGISGYVISIHQRTCHNNQWRSSFEKLLFLQIGQGWCLDWHFAFSLATTWIPSEIRFHEYELECPILSRHQTRHCVSSKQNSCRCRHSHLLFWANKVSSWCLGKLDTLISMNHIINHAYIFGLFI